MNKKLLNWVVLGVMLVGMLAACAPTPSLSVESVWGKPSPSVAGAGAFFMVIKNTSTVDDKLVAVKSPACGMTELHTTVMKSDGTSMMQLVTDGIPVPANGQLELKSGSFHIMCLKMQTDQMSVGAEPSLTLTFEKSGDRVIPVEMKQ
jgi:periplasmic copper chaperone A